MDALVSPRGKVAMISVEHHAEPVPPIVLGNASLAYWGPR